MKTVDLSDETAKEFLIRIGKIIVDFNHLESIVEMVILQLINIKKGTDENSEDEQSIGRRVVEKLFFMQKIDLLRSLIVGRKGEEFAKKFTKQVYKELVSVSEKRNDIVHSMWFIQYGNSKTDLSTLTINFQNAYQRGKSFNFEEAKKDISLEKLDETLSSIDKAVKQLIHYAVNMLNT